MQVLQLLLISQVFPSKYRHKKQEQVVECSDPLVTFSSHVDVCIALQASLEHKRLQIGQSYCNIGSS